MKRLENEGVLNIPQDMKDAVSGYHAGLIKTFSGRFDTDSSDAEKKLSWGMRVLTFLGGMALCASIFFSFYRIWGLIPTTIQVAILITFPVLFLAAMPWAAKKEISHYYATLLGLAAFVGFILNLNAMGSMFNITPSQNAFLIWGLLGIALAYYLGLRLLLLAGLLSLLGYLSATVGAWSGGYWLSFGERPENFMVGGAIMVALPMIFKHRHFYNFPWFYQLVGLISIFIAILIMSFNGRASYLFTEIYTVERSYELLGFLLSGVTIWLGIRTRQTGVANIGATFFTIFLYTKFFDWWWDKLPKYIFFLVMSGVTIGLLVIIKSIRSRFKEST